MVTSMSVQADIYDVINFFDFSKIVQGSFSTIQGVADNLEKIRQIQQAQFNIQDQWDLACETTQSLYKGIEVLNKELIKQKINQKYCAPITTVLSLQADIIRNCQNYYSKPVPNNVDALMRKSIFSLIQTRSLLVKCYPELAKIKMPIPGTSQN